MRVIRKPRANGKALSNVRAVRLCPADFERAGQVQSLNRGGFGVVCPVCPAVL